MSANIPAFFVQQYASNVQLLLQQKGSRLRGTVTTGNYVGKSAQVVDQIGKISMQAVSGRFQAMGRVDAAMDSRWVFPSDFDLPQMIDSFDKLRLLTDPTSAYVQNAVNAAGRKFDELILAAAVGTAKTGENGGTNTTLPVGQVIAAAAGTIVDKIIEGKKMLMAADVDVDSDPLYMAITADEHALLLAEDKIINMDYGMKPVLVDGKITQFLGVNLIHTELADANLDGSSDAILPMWAKSGLHLGVWNDITTDISRRNDIQSLPYQSYVHMTAGATRLEEKKVVGITFNR